MSQYTSYYLYQKFEQRGDSAFADTNCPIYVPNVDAYKAAEGWSNYASRIQAIP